MAYVNERWFNNPDTLGRARGESASPRTELVAPDGKVVARIVNGGIAAPRRDVLHPGTRLVRYGSKRLEHGRTNLSATGLFGTAARGEWWLEWSQYRRVEAFADARGVGIGVAVRLLCCVPLDWSDLDLVVQARVTQPLLAYRGTANAATSGVGTATAEHLPVIAGLDGAQVEQIFIPGLSGGDVLRDAVAIEGTGFLSPDVGRKGYIVRPA